jgi:NitT/TauT family transport system substrate-binding protein
MRLSTAGEHRPGRMWSTSATRRVRAFAAVFAGLAPLLVVTGCDPLASHSGTEQVTVGAVPGIENANLYLAEHDGYFAKAGVSVKIVQYSSVSKEITALSQGSVDVISADYGDIFYDETVQSNPIYKLLADGYDAAPGVIEIVTMPNSSVKTPADLAGQKIPVPNVEVSPAPPGAPNTLARTSAISVLQSDGVNLAAVQWESMPQSQEITELTKDQVPAILVSGLGVYDAQQQGAVELIDACSGPTSGIPLDGFFASAGWLSQAKNLAAGRAFRAGIYNADAAATMPGPIQAILPAWLGPGSGMTKQEAGLVTTGTYPLSTIVANVQRTAILMDSEGMTASEVNVTDMLRIGPSSTHSS